MAVSGVKRFRLIQLLIFVRLVYLQSASLIIAELLLPLDAFVLLLQLRVLSLPLPLVTSLAPQLQLLI